VFYEIFKVKLNRWKRRFKGLGKIREREIVVAAVFIE
jgi:hypothetical protein